MTEQVIDINELKEILPSGELCAQRRKSIMGRFYLEIQVRVNPSISQEEYDKLLKRIIAFYGEDLLDLTNEETGRFFTIYLRMSQTFSTTVII